MAEIAKSIVSRGSRAAKIVIVGEAPGAEEVQKGIPFVGASGKELDKMLIDAGIYQTDPLGNILNKDDIYFTNVVMTRPKDNDIENWVQRSLSRSKNKKKQAPEYWQPYRGWLCEPHVIEDAKRLVEDLKEINPNVIIALGNTPFWALCQEGITGKVGTWRGSTLLSDTVPGTKVIPVYHPAFILRQWQHRRISVQDLRRAKAASTQKELPPVGWDFTLSPTYDQCAAWLCGVLGELEKGPVKLVTDIEGAQNKTLCVGIATSSKRAICIPLLYKNGFYFSNPDQRFVIYTLMQRVLMHKNARVCNQAIGFDTQFLVQDLLIYPNIVWDTMIAQNVLFPGTPMNLAYQASMYCKQYRYWKDDSEEFWKAKRISNWEQIWFYNCEDCCRTFEVWEKQEASLKTRKLEKQFEFLMYKVFPLIMKAMFRGVRVNLEMKERMLRELLHLKEWAQQRVNKLVTRRLDIASSVQLKDFFYNELKMPVQLSQPKGGEEPKPTCDADAMIVLGNLDPLIKPVCELINLYRSYNAAVTVCKAQTEKDGRWRSQYSLGIVETYRLSSKENPFGRGLNLMNISAGE